jgi:hypothetical protein
MGTIKSDMIDVIALFFICLYNFMQFGQFYNRNSKAKIILFSVLTRSGRQEGSNAEVV